MNISDATRGSLEVRRFFPDFRMSDGLFLPGMSDALEHIGALAKKMEKTGGEISASDIVVRLDAAGIWLGPGGAKPSKP